MADNRWKIQYKNYNTKSKKIQYKNYNTKSKKMQYKNYNNNYNNL